MTTRSLTFRFAIIVLIATTATACAQSIYTIAGGGSLDGRPVLLSPVFPAGFVVTANRDLYLADFQTASIDFVPQRTGIISIIAGNGSSGATGDGGQAVRAGLQPSDVVRDTHGNLYILAQFNNNIRRIDGATGVITTVAGDTNVSGFDGDGGPAAAARLQIGAFYGTDSDGASAMAIDASNNLYFTDTFNHRIRRIDAATGIITTVAGSGPVGASSGSFSGDGGLATSATLNRPGGIAIDANGNLYIADVGNDRIRKVTKSTGVITTIAGNGNRGYGGDRGPATGAPLGLSLTNIVSGIALDSAANVYFSDPDNSVVRRVDQSTGVITTAVAYPSAQDRGDGGDASLASLITPGALHFDTADNLYIADEDDDLLRMVLRQNNIINTIAGNGDTAIGDNGPALSTQLFDAQAITFDSAGNLYIADANDVRVVNRSSGNIVTIAGHGSSTDPTGPALEALLAPSAVAVDGQSVYIAEDCGSVVHKLNLATGNMTTIAGMQMSGCDGGYSGDNGPATSARLNAPRGLVIDHDHNIYVADRKNQRVRKIDSFGVIATVAGTGIAGFSGDGGPATSAQLNEPWGLAFDAAGALYIADSQNHAIRRIMDGTITTVAGTGVGGWSGDGGPAVNAKLEEPRGVAFDRDGNMYIAVYVSNVVRKVTPAGIISVFAGNGTPDFRGDYGPATKAELSPMAVATFGNDVYIADDYANRIRVVPACIGVNAPQLQQPADGSSSEKLSPKLAWNPVNGAFHYDVDLDTANPPQRLIASDLTVASYSPANLEPLTKYYWKVAAKGDPFCDPFSTADSEVRSFTTTGVCSEPGTFSATATVSGDTLQLSWSASARSSSYDIAIGPTNPPRVYASGLTSAAQTVSGLAPGTAYYWSVTAHASCEPARMTSTAVQSFTTSGTCGQPAGVTLKAPGDGEGSVSPTATLSWNAAAGAAAYNVYLGSGPNPALYLSDLEQTSVTIPQLSAGAEYSWKVVAKAACDPSKNVSSALRRFTVTSCGSPGAPSITDARQGNVIAGATYAISWSKAAGMDAAASYLIERATDPQFSNIVDHQETTATSASFLSATAGTFYHRVRSIAGCDRSRRSQPSDTATVNVSAGAPVVIFTMQPQAVITRLGERLEDQRTSFALENLSNAPVQVLIAPQLLGGSVPFFTISDPLGGDPNFATLESHKPKTLKIRFSGPANDQRGSYQGSIYVTSSGQPLAFTPQAYVNLKVGGDASAAAPRLLVGGRETELAFFPPLTGDDSARPSITVDLVNSGNVPMEVAGEIGPEAWLKLEKDWNTTAVPETSVRPLRLSTQRTRAVAGSALPRYTYLTVGNKAGQSARLLVEDTGGVTAGRGRSAPLSPGDLSLIVPSVRSGSSGATALHLTNTSSSAVPFELIWTPEGSDGFDANNVLRLALVIPPNDVVSLTDPLAHLLGTTGEASGSLEIRSSAEKLGSLVVRADVHGPAPGGGTYGYAVPVVLRGEGARIGTTHRIPGATSTSALKTAVVIAETSGRDKATVHVALYDNGGIKRGEQTFVLARYGSKRIDDVAAALAGGSDVQGGHIDVTVTSDGGSVFGLATVLDRTSGSGASLVGQPVGTAIHLSALGRLMPSSQAAAAAAAGQELVVAGITNEAGSTTTFGINAVVGTNVKLTYRDGSSGQSTVRNIALTAGQTVEYTDVVQAVTGAAAPSHGTITIDSDNEISVYARLRNGNVIDALPVVSPFGEALTGGGSTKPVYVEGLEQTIDPGIGTHPSLILTEVAGQGSVVTVRLYEPGNRSVPIAEKDFALASNSELRLDNLFSAMGLESGPDDLEQRKKDRVNVVAIVTAKTGAGVVQSLAIITDNRTGDRRTIQLQPAGGLPATGPQLPLAPASATPAKRRAVRH